MKPKIDIEIGDKLLCKRDYYSANLYANKYYEVINCNFKYFYDIFNTYVSIKSEDDEIYFANGKTTEYRYNIWDFFYTPKEIRKLKLDKINEKNNKIL